MKFNNKQLIVKGGGQGGDSIFQIQILGMMDPIWSPWLPCTCSQLSSVKLFYNCNIYLYHTLRAATIL